MKLTVLSICTFLLFSLPLGADIITFKNGKEIEVIIVGQSRSNIVYMIDGKRKSALKIYIRRIKYGAVKTELIKQAENRKRLEEMKRQVAKTDKQGGSSKRMALLIKEFEEEVRKEEERFKEEQLRRSKMVASMANELEKAAGEEKKLDKEEENPAGRDEVFNREKDSVARGDSGLEGEVTSSEDRNPVGALFRSALIPGWGQYYSRRNRSGMALFTATIALAGSYMTSRSSYDSAHSSFDFAARMGFLLPRDTSSLPPALLLYQRAQSSDSLMASSARNANSAALLLGFLYLYNLFDSYYFSVIPSGSGFAPDERESRGNFSISRPRSSPEGSDRREQHPSLSFSLIF